MRSVAHRRDVAVANRIEVQVVHVGAMIAIVADRMLSVSPLPEASLALAGRLGEIRSPGATDREKRALINRQRIGKSESPSGSCQMQCR